MQFSAVRRRAHLSAIHLRTLIAACAVVLTASACGNIRPEDLHNFGIPLERDGLVGGDYVVFVGAGDLSRPDGDSITFHADGIVTSTQAALSGQWSIVDDSTLSIRATVSDSAPAHLFRVRIPDGEMISPLPDGTAARPEFRIRARGSMRMFGA